MALDSMRPSSGTSRGWSQIGPDWPWPSNFEFGAEGRDHWPLRISKRVLAAYEAARMARFEHGESGAS